MYLEFEVLAEEFIADFWDGFLEEARRPQNIDDGNQAGEEILHQQKRI